LSLVDAVFASYTIRKGFSPMQKTV